MTRKVFNIAAGMLLAILLIVVTTLAFAGLYDSPEYVRRLLTYGQSDLNDIYIFPERPILKGGAPSRLEQGELITSNPVTWHTPDGQAHTADLQEIIDRTDTRALIVIRDDRIIYEGYFNDTTRESINTSFSSAKSFNSALIGAALADGLIESVDDSLIRYIPEISGRGFDDLTIRDLLLMSTGIHYAEPPAILKPFGDDALTYYSPDLRRAALLVRASGTPVGEAWHYNNYHPLLEGLLLERVTGMAVADYLQERFWQPMGAEFDASWSLDSEESGFEKMESGINARAIDYARFGMIFLHNGFWNGRQILPESWVRESTSPEDAWEIPIFDPNLSAYYKYHWWGFNNPDGTYDYFASGRYGQYIYIAPRKNVVVVRLGGEPADYPVSWPRIIHNLVDQLE